MLQASRKLWIAGGVLAALVGALTGLLLASKTAAVSSRLVLSLKEEGSRFQIEWDRANELVRNARDGVLEIDDGLDHRRVRLTADEVSDGRVMYTPHSDDVSFRLEVNGRNGVTVSQGLRLLDGGTTQQQQAPQAQQVEEIPVPTPPAPAQQRVVRMVHREPAPAVRKFKAPTLLPTTAPKAGNAPPDGPPVIDLHLASSAPVLSGLWQPLDVPPPPQAQVKRRVVPGYIPPRIVQKVLPQTATLRNVVRAGDGVQVLASIDTEGNVAGVRLLGPKAVSPIVLQAVVQAARQWRFTPAMLRGSPIPSEYRISFQFAP